MERDTMCIDVQQDEAGVVAKLRQLIQESSEQAVKERDVFILAVSGGSVVNMLAKALPEMKCNWSKWLVLFCDERLVPESDPESTYGLYKTKLIPLIPELTDKQFLPIDFSLCHNAEEAARDYEKLLKERLPESALHKDSSGRCYPRLDCGILGMGPDGHTCSLFPGHELLTCTRWVAPITDSPKPPPGRVTLTLPLLNSARLIVFPITGSSKASTVQAVLETKSDLPAALVKPSSGSLVWLLDTSAASMLKHST